MQVMVDRQGLFEMGCRNIQKLRYQAEDVEEDTIGIPSRDNLIRKPCWAMCDVERLMGSPIPELLVLGVEPS